MALPNSDISKLFYEYNLTGIPSGTSKVPDISPIPDSNGDYTISYTIFDESAALNGTYYEGFEEQTDFADGTDYLQHAEDAFVNVLTLNDAWGVSFTDVAKINFQEETSGIGILAIGQLTNEYSIIQSLPAAMAFAAVYDNVGVEVHGDIFVNVDHSSSRYSGINMWDVDGGTSDPIAAGEYSWTLVHQELLHALGVDVYADATQDVSAFDSHKYTVTSYNFHPGMGNYNSTDGTGPHAYGLQLYDVVSLQEIYGRNWDTRSGNTTYQAGANEAFGSAANAFIYTIWDGDGTDTIDASAYTNPQGSIIDLRQGQFSSIGLNAEGGAAQDNVAVAYHAIIENAIGTANADIIIGNAWDNDLQGGDGNDRIFGDGMTLEDDLLIDMIYDNDAGFGTGAGEHDPNNPASAPNSNQSGNDTLNGGNGDDHLYGGAGDDILDGGADNDIIRGGSGNDIIVASIGDDENYGDGGDDVFYADSSLNQSLWFDGGADNDLVYLAGKSSSDYTQGAGHVYTSIADPNIVLEFFNVESVVFGADLNSYAASMASINSISITQIDPEMYVKPLSSSNGNYTRDLSADGGLATSSSLLGDHTGASFDSNLLNSYVEWDMYRRSPDEVPSDPVTLSANSLVVDRYTITAPSGSSGWTEFSIIVNENIGGYFGKNETYGFDLWSGVYALMDISTANTGYAGTLQYNVFGTWYARNVDFSDSGYNPVVDGIDVGEGFVGSLQTEIQFRFTGPEITFDHYLGAYINGLGHTGVGSGKSYSGYGSISSEIVVPTGANVVAESGYVPGGYDVSALQQDWLGTIAADDFTGAGFSETVYTYEGADIIAAGTGNDILYGGVDSDTYIFNAGDGQDTINDVQGFDDAIRLGPGIVETDLTLTQVGNNLEITFAGTGTDKITIVDHYDTATYNQIEKIIFDDDSELALSIPDPSPILTNNGGAVDEDGTLTLTAAMLDATDIDNTDSELVFTLTSIPTDGVLKKDGVSLGVTDSFTVQDILDSKVTFEPAADFNGADGFGFSLSDGENFVSGQTFAITVNAVNDAPAAQDDAFNGTENMQITGNVLADNGNGADSDVENDTLGVTAGTFATPQGGSITLQTNGDFTYTPATDFTGSDSYQYTVNDGNGGQDTGDISFDVAPESVAEPPTTDQVFVLDPVSVDTIANSTAINNDTFVAKTISVAFETGSDVTTRQVIYEQGGGNRGIAIFVENGKLYQAMWNYYAGTNWGYKAIEADIVASTEYTSTLVFSASSQSSGTLDAYLDATHIGSETGLGYLYAHSEAVGIGQMKDGSRFHNNNESGNGHTFTGQIDKVAHYNAALQGSTLDQLHDYMGAGSGSPPANVDPVAQDDVFNGDEDTQIIGNVLADNGNGADSDADSDPLSVTSGTFATTQGGSITLQSNGDFTYTPATDFSGTDDYQYTVSDGNGGQDTATITFDVAPESTAEPPTADQVFVLDPVTVDTVASSTAVNNDTFIAKTISLAFETGSDVTTRQVIYEQGGGNRGIAIFVENGKLYQAMWNYYAGTNWGYKAIEIDVMASTEYTSTLVFSASSQSTGTLDAYLNATHVGSETGLGHLYAHSEAVGIGQMKDGSRFHNNNENGDGHTFTGQIDKVAHYNAALQGTTLDQLHEYIGDGWLPAYYEINGTSSSDVLNGSQFNDEIAGGGGDDAISALDGDDLLYGGSGNDIMYGGDGADTFVFESGTISGFVDTISDFSVGEGDMLDIANIIAYDPLTDAITDFVQFTDDGTDSFLAVDVDGGADNFVQIATLLGVTGLTDEAALESGGHLIAA